MSFDIHRGKDDPRYQNRKSGVNVLDDVIQSWSEVRDDSNTDIDYIILSYIPNSKTDITTLCKGNGGITKCSLNLPNDIACFGGCKILCINRFVSWYYLGENVPVVTKGRASMHKNGVLNVLSGCDAEITIRPGITEEEVLVQMKRSGGGTAAVAVAGGSGSGSGSGASTTTGGVSSNGVNRKIVQVAGPIGDTGAGTKSGVNGGGGGMVGARKTNNGLVQKSTTTITTRTKKMTMTGGDNNVHDKKKDGSTSSSSSSNNGDTKNDDKTLLNDTTTTTTKTIPYSELKEIRDESQLPQGIQMSNRQDALSKDEFMTVFNMNKNDFDKLPKWKRDNLKRAKGLF